MNVVTETGAFSQFPNFTRLTLAHKTSYESLIRLYPAVDDIAFSSLMGWWNPLDNMSIALLNDNLVIPYWMAGAEKHSGLSLVGTNKVDESICAIFDHQRERGEQPRLVNVGDFVIANIQYPELFVFKEERQYSEYIYPLSRFYPLRNMPLYWRRKVQKRIERVGASSVVRSLDLGDPANRRLLLDAMEEWSPQGINDLGRVEKECLRTYAENADALDIENACLFVDGKLHGFCIYHMPFDKRYISVKHIKATERSSLGFEYIAYELAKHLSERGIKYVNLTNDQGLLSLRMFMLALGPMNYFRKYTVEPAV